MTGPQPPLGSATLDDVVNELQSVVSLMQKQTSATTDNTSNAKQAQANNEATKRLALLGVAASTVAHQLYSLAAAGVKFAETIGVSATQGIQLDLNNRRTLLMQLRDIDLNRMATMQQIQAVEKSYVDTFLNVSEGMQLSAEGAQRLATNLKTGLGSEFQLSAQGMRALITVGASTTAEFENLRKASGRKALSDSQLANLTNKNSLSFMLYGPRFAKAAADAEKLGISLASVQSAQESMVTNLDGTIDTVAQINQLGGQVDFGTLTQLAETGGPEEVLRYLQSTIPPALFQSASTRALLKGFNVPIEDLMKSGDSAQARAARSFSDQLEEPTKEASRLAGAFAGLYAIVEKITGALKPLIVILGAIAGAMGINRVLNGGLNSLFGGRPRPVPTVPIPTTLSSGYGPSAIAGIMGNQPPQASSVPPTSPASNSFAAIMKSWIVEFQAGITRLSTSITGVVGRLMSTAPMVMVKNAASNVGNFIARPLQAIGASLGKPVTAMASVVQRLSATRPIQAITSVGSSVSSKVASVGVSRLAGSALGGVLGGISGFRTAKNQGADTQTAMGAGAIQGVFASVGALLGTIGGPIGMMIGGFFGDMLGKAVNKWFPELASMIGDSLKSLVNAFEPLKNAFMMLWESAGNLWQTIQPLAQGLIENIVMPIGRLAGVVVGGALGVALVLLVESLSLAARAISFVVTGWTLLASTLTDGMNWLVNLIPNWMRSKSTTDTVTPTAATTPQQNAPRQTSMMERLGSIVRGDDVISRPGYGERTLATPSGPIALNNKDTVVAYANDMVSSDASTRILSLGTLARGAESSPTTTDPVLIGKITDLITMLGNANTTIEVGGQTQKVNRMQLVGVYSRNEIT